MIVPADARSGSAKDAGAAPFIELLCSQNAALKQIYTGGLLWLDGEMGRRDTKPFLYAAESKQTGLLDEFAKAQQSREEREKEAAEGRPAPDGFYGARPLGDLSPGVTFYDWPTKMTVDAFYTSEIGVKDLDYRGNHAYASYEVRKEVIEYALKRSPVWGQSGEKQRLEAALDDIARQ